ILLLPPFYENFGKRLVKSPKLHFADSGLACHLLGIRTEAELRRSVFLGPLFEGFVASEIVKQQINGGRRKEVYYFRDQQGLEVDLVVPGGGRSLALVEVKATRTVRPEMAEPLMRLGRVVRGHVVDRLLVHRSAGDESGSKALRRGVQAVSVDQLLQV